MIRVFFVGTVRLYIDGITALLDGCEEMRVIGCAAPDDELALDAAEPDVFVVDAQSQESLAAIPRLLSTHERAKVVAVGSLTTKAR